MAIHFCKRMLKSPLGFKHDVTLNNLLQRFSLCSLALSHKETGGSDNTSKAINLPPVKGFTRSNLLQRSPYYTQEETKSRSKVGSSKLPPEMRSLKQKILNNDLLQVFPYCSRTLFDTWCKKYGKDYDTEEIREEKFKIFTKYFKQRTNLGRLADLKPNEKPSPPLTYSHFLNPTLAGFTTKNNEHLLKSGIIGCNSVDEWEENFRKSIKSKKLVVIFFTCASYKGPDFRPPILAKIVKKNSHIVFLEVDTDELETIGRDFKVQLHPTFVFVKEGVVVEHFWGFDMNTLRATIYKHDDLTF